jgi:hypothetical protein
MCDNQIESVVESTSNDPSSICAFKQRIAETLAAFAKPDEAWGRGGRETMYFEHPVATKTVLGTVEIDSTTDKLESAKLELFAPPSVIARVVQLIMAMDVEDSVPEHVEEEEEDTAPVLVSLPPTKEPSPEDLLEEPEGLPPEVLASDPDLDQVEV